MIDGQSGDPAADVALGQDNTGAATVFPDHEVQPIQIYEKAQGRIDTLRQQQQAQLLAKHNAQKAAEAKDLTIPDEKGAFPLDIQREIAPAVNKYLNQYGQWQRAGSDPTNPADPTYLQAHQMKADIENQIQASVQHNSDYNKTIAELGGANADKYDQGTSATALTQWMNSPSIAERSKLPVPTPIQNYDLNKGITDVVKEMKPTVTSSAYKDPKTGAVSEREISAYDPEAIGVHADALIHQPQIYKAVDKQFMAETPEVAKQFTNFETYKANNPNWKPADNPLQIDMSPDRLASVWDKASGDEKAVYGNSFDKFTQALNDANQTHQEAADRALYAGLPLSEQMKYGGNRRDYLNHLLITAAGPPSIPKATISGGASYDDINGGGSKANETAYEVPLNKQKLIINNDPTATTPVDPKLLSPDELTAYNQLPYLKDKSQNGDAPYRSSDIMNGYSMGERFVTANGQPANEFTLGAKKDDNRIVKTFVAPNGDGAHLLQDGQLVPFTKDNSLASIITPLVNSNKLNNERMLKKAKDMGISQDDGSENWNNSVPSAPEPVTTKTPDVSNIFAKKKK